MSVTNIINSMRNKAGIAVAVAALTLATGCADYTNRAALENPDVDPDPAESVNRVMFDIHEVIDRVILKPVTQAYRFIMPEPGREVVSNFVSNLGSPVIFANSVLQGDVDNSFATFWRFTINTTFGVGGLFDVAETADLYNRKTDFGETMAVWGVDSGPYVFVPVIGPGTVRDMFGRVVDIAFNPVVYDDTEWLTWAQLGITILDSRSRNYQTIEDIYRSSLDPYTTIRSSYLQNRTDGVIKARAASYTANYECLKESKEESEGQ